MCALSACRHWISGHGFKLRRMIPLNNLLYIRNKKKKIKIHNDHQWLACIFLLMFIFYSLYILWCFCCIFAFCSDSGEKMLISKTVKCKSIIYPLNSKNRFWAVESHLILGIYFQVQSRRQLKEGFIHSQIQSFIQQLWSSYCVSVIQLGTSATMV